MIVKTVLRCRSKEFCPSFALLGEIRLLSPGTPLMGYSNCYEKCSQRSYRESRDDGLCLCQCVTR